MDFLPIFMPFVSRSALSSPGAFWVLEILSMIYVASLRYVQSLNRLFFSNRKVDEALFCFVFAFVEKRMFMKGKVIKVT